jgi:hypothetical protein
LYAGRMPDPTGSLPRVDTDANEGRAGTRARNLAQAELETTEQPEVTGEKVPAWHGVQTSAVVASATSLYLPAGQRAHVPSVVAAVSLLYVPATHAVHVELAEAPTAAEYVPAPQLVHRVASVAPVAVEYVPAPQSVHTSDPVDVLNFPAKHVSQLEAFQYKPALHTQAASPALQVLHELADAPVAVEYVPDVQLVHWETPTSGEYLPAPQSVQLADPVDTLYFPARTLPLGIENIFYSSSGILCCKVSCCRNNITGLKTRVPIDSRRHPTCLLR